LRIGVNLPVTKFCGGTPEWGGGGSGLVIPSWHIEEDVMYRVTTFAAAVLLCASTAFDRAGAAELKVLSPGATESSLSEILPQFERATEHKLKIEYGPVGALANRVKKGEAVDVVILSEPVAEELRKDSVVVAGSEALIAKVGVGVFVRKGAPKPDISSMAAFMRAISNARIIAYADPKLGGSASIYVGNLMESLDVTGSIGPKTKLVPPAKPLLDLVAKGDVEFGFGPISEILPDPRLEVVGPLPAEIQNYSKYVAGVVTTSKQHDAGKALIAYLASPAATAVFKTKGFE
jgi:molybdate transport system substrate-binding protein